MSHDYHADVRAALRRASDALIVVSDGLIATNRAMVDAFEASEAAAAEHARVTDEQGDLRETVARLETLILEQGKEIRQLRADLRGPE